jgi:transcriptional regulator with XRE-family HTH domain
MKNGTDHLGAAEATVVPLELVDGPCGPVSFGDLISTFRMCDEMSQAELARVLGVSESYVFEIENGDKVVSPEMAVAWADCIGYPATVFVERALQDQLDRAGVEMKVHVEAIEIEEFD